MVFNNNNKQLMIPVITWGIRISLLVTLIAIFVPWLPWMPASGLDPSWCFAINQAVAQGLSFGREVIYMFGPYGSIYTRQYHPATDSMMIIGSLYLALNYWIALIFLMKKNKWRWSIAYGLALPAIIFCSRDALLFSYPLIVALASYRLVSFPKMERSNWSRWMLPCLFFPLGLLALTKGSLILLCCFVPLWCSWFFFLNQERYLAVLCPCMTCIAVPFFWIASGASFLDLPSYFISMENIVSGYTQAMAIESPREILVYPFVCVVLSSAIFFQKKITLSI